MTPDQASVIAGFLLPQIEQEVETTVRVLGAVPDEKKDYSPDAKCMNAGVLAEHIASSDLWFLEAIINGGVRPAIGSRAMPEQRTSPPATANALPN